MNKQAKQVKRIAGVKVKSGVRAGFGYNDRS